MNEVVKIEYGPNEGTNSQVLYLHQPEGEGPKPLLIWIHGGGLVEGDASEDIKGFPWLVAEGYAVASVEYRMYPDASYPDFIDDVQLAVSFLLDNADKYSLNGRYFISGHSAGGYLALMAPLKPLKDGNRLKPLGIIALSAQCFTHYLVRNELHGSEYPVRIDEAAPVFNIYQGQPPVLLAAGTEDIPARLEEDQYMHAYMQSNGMASEFHIIDGADHVGTVSAPDGSFNPEVAGLIRAFITRHNL